MSLAKKRRTGKAGEDHNQKSVFLTLSEVAELLRVSPMTVYRMARKGEIPGAFRLGHRWRFSVEELEHLIKDDDQAD
jgi:excisionase family DNA binding protein